MKELAYTKTTPGDYFFLSLPDAEQLSRLYVSLFAFRVSERKVTKH